MTRRVMIGTPSMDGHQCAEYTYSLAETVREGTRRGIEIRPLILMGSLIQHARNELVQMAHHFGMDDLFFIDADQGWQPDWFFQMLGHPVDCVGAPVRKKIEAEVYNVKTAKGPMGFMGDKQAKLLTTDDLAVGTGFLRLSKGAIDALWADVASNVPYVSFDGTAKSEEMRWIFDLRPVDGVLVGEDTCLADKLRRVGVETWLDPSFTVPHYGGKCYAGNFLAWLGRMQAAAQTPETGKAGSGVPVPAEVKPSLEPFVVA